MESHALKICVSDRVNDAPEALKVVACEMVQVRSASQKAPYEAQEYCDAYVPVFISTDHFPMPSVTLTWPPLMARAPSLSSYYPVAKTAVV